MWRVADTARDEGPSTTMITTSQSLVARLERSESRERFCPRRHLPRISLTLNPGYGCYGDG